MVKLNFMKNKVIYDISLLTDFDIYLFKEGNHFFAYEKLGSHPIEVNGVRGTYFALWAPNAQQVYVMGDFNGWDRYSHPLSVRWDGSGIWEGFIPGVDRGTRYKYYIVSKFGYHLEKGDPYAFLWETPPATASIVWELDYSWNDTEWMKNRHKINSLNAPISIYEVHLGSWKRAHDGRLLTYREMAQWLPDYVKTMGFTHVEFLPVMEHPFYGSWGYQVVGYFAPTSRYGTPQDFMYLVDVLHQNGIGVILDWVASHFPDDAHGLCFFDGTYLYEHQDPKKGYHPHWHSYIFNYGRNEVRNFLISSALFWLDKYHIDALRVDAVASMLYLDYGRAPGEWIPNKYGGKENLEAIDFLRRLNQVVYEKFPDTQTIAEESTAWPMVSRPTYLGGLGFGMKWNMGWMHDSLQYFSKDPIYRKYHHNQITFSIWYAFSENFVLPLSHDEVVYGKGSLVGKMPGDYWQKFANLRLLYCYMYAHPGKKLLFMGGEFAQWDEWYHETELHWHLLQYPAHQGVQRLIKDLNSLYRTEPALYELDFDPSGFEWIDFSDAEQSVFSFIRKGKNQDEIILAVFNCTPVPRQNYRVGVPRAGFWKEILNSDSEIYGGTNLGNYGGTYSEDIPFHGRPYSVKLTLPPLAALFFKLER